jgi:hypothetical protein
MAILNEIEMLRQQLHSLIDQNASYDTIYSKSVELDLLISKFYSVKAR